MHERSLPPTWGRIGGGVDERQDAEPAGDLPQARPAVRTGGLVARRDPVRGLPGCDPGAEHVLDERRAGPRAAAAGGPALVRGALPAVRLAHRLPDPPLRDLPGEGLA